MAETRFEEWNLKLESGGHQAAPETISANCGSATRVNLHQNQEGGEGVHVFHVLSFMLLHCCNALPDILCGMEFATAQINVDSAHVGPLP